ncbi:ion channel [uncultured Desulfosarcina sp.]|uniref:ion channel n=1 Tax=uncultured Desulfosarcina sp. TaxID=218289 RepID=UPI0029C8FD2F|nr:ion channel [uncultured Desulfosarcina sp.]
MSVPLYDINMLWSLNHDDFNKWRSTHDLPILLSFFKKKLPGFTTWLNEFDIDDNLFCSVMPTGHLFVGHSPRLLIQNKDEDNINNPYWSYSVVDLDKEVLVKRYTNHGIPIPSVIKTFLPYFIWGKNKLKKNRFIDSDKANKGKTDTFVYNLWSGLGPHSRASLFKTFQVLKLGGVTLGKSVVIGGRNLDFVDIDTLRVEGEWHGSRQTYVHFSSCREMSFCKAELAFLKFVGCKVDKFSCQDCRLQDFSFDQSSLIEARFIQCKIVGLIFDRCGVSAEFDKCDISEVKYIPKKGALRSDIQMYRRLRTAFQNAGKRKEASNYYYLERKAERKALFKPLVYYSIEFPRKPHPGPFKRVLGLWKKGHVTKTELAFHIIKSTIFHSTIWLKYKTRYSLSLIEELVWGYGEKPIRILISSLAILSIYSFAYFKLFNLPDLPSTPAKYSLVDCMYFSIVTFTTLGYGDITPKTDIQKFVCGSEALFGALFIGLIIAGFANKSKY